MITPGVLALLLAAIGLDWHHDPRKFRIGLLLVALITWVLLALTVASVAGARELDELGGAYVLLAVLVLLLVTVVAFAGFLVVTGVTLLRREGVRLSHGLSLGLGLALLAYVGLGVWVVSANVYGWVIVVFLLGLPAGYLGFAFVAFLLYGSLYPALMGRSGGPAAVVVVLGSGLVRGRVPPLLAARLRRGRQVYDRLAAKGSAPLLATSGGQGADEPMAEAEAMAEFLIADGIPSDRILVEDRSRNTEENLLNTAQLLRANGVQGPVVAVTSDFHAFRAALLMREHGIAGYAVGAPTAHYYWPSAVIREFIAVLRDHLWLNVVLLGMSSLPLLAWLVVLLAQLVIPA